MIANPPFRSTSESSSVHPPYVPLPSFFPSVYLASSACFPSTLGATGIEAPDLLEETEEAEDIRAVLTEEEEDDTLSLEPPPNIDFNLFIFAVLLVGLERNGVW